MSESDGEKHRDYLFGDPALYVNELVRAAVASGASFVDVKMDADDMILRFDGLPYRPEDLGRLFEYLPADDPERRRLRYLALAILNARALNPKFLTLESGGPDFAHRIRFDSAGEALAETIASWEGAAGTRVHLKERMGLKVMAEATFWKNPEEKILVDQCRFAPIAVRLNGRDLREAPGPAAVVRKAFELDGFRGALALDWTAKPVPGRITFCQDGVKLWEWEAPTGDWQNMVAFIDSPLFASDADSGGIRRDEFYREAMDLLTLQFRALLMTWLRQELLESDGRAPKNRLGKAQRLAGLRAAARVFLRASESGPLPPALEALLDVQNLVQLALSWPHTSSLRPFWNSARDQGLVRVASRNYPVSDHDLGVFRLQWGIKVVALGPSDLLQTVFAECLEFVDAELRQISRQKGYEIVEGLKIGQFRPKLTRDQALVQIEVSEGKSWGQAGLSAQVPEQAGVKVTFLRHGRFVATEFIEDAKFCGTILVETGDFWWGLGSTEASTQAKSHGEAIALIADLAPDLLHALCEQIPEPPPPASLMRQRCWQAGKEQDCEQTDIGLNWAHDSRATMARWHIDRILPANFSKLDDWPSWLRYWPLFFRLDGSAVSLAWLLAGPEAPIRYVYLAPWGHDFFDVEVLNLSTRQVDFLKTLFGSRLSNYSTRLRLRRADT